MSYTGKARESPHQAKMRKAAAIANAKSASINLKNKIGFFPRIFGAFKVFIQKLKNLFFKK